jgi:hypothetical protein
MAVIKALEKTYILKSVGIPDYYLGGNVEFLGETWKNQRLGLALSAKTYIQNVTPKFESLFGKEIKPIKTPMSEGYYPEVDDSSLTPNTLTILYILLKIIRTEWISTQMLEKRFQRIFLLRRDQGSG